MNRKLAVVLGDVFGLRPEMVVLTLRKDDVDSWDSLKQMDLVTSLEQTYEIALEIDDIVAMTSVQAIVDVLRRKGVTLEP